MRITLRSLALAFGLIVPAMAQTALPQASGIMVAHAWSRATPSAHSSAVVYLTLTDTGAADRLTGASTPVAAKAQLHETKTENGIMKMRPVDGVDIGPVAPLTLSPDGYHLMLTGLTQTLSPKETFPLTLTFAHAAPVTITVTVEAAGAAKPMGAMKGMDGMDGMDMK